MSAALSAYILDDRSGDRRYIPVEDAHRLSYVLPDGAVLQRDFFTSPSLGWRCVIYGNERAALHDVRVAEGFVLFLVWLLDARHDS